MAMAKDAMSGLTPSIVQMIGASACRPQAIVKAIALTVPRLCGGARSSDIKNVKLLQPLRQETKTMMAK